MEEKGPTLGYWKIRGLGELAKLIMEYGKKPYQIQYYQATPPPELSPHKWFDKKYTLGLDFPNLPYLIEGDFKITECMNIYLYLMKKYVPELLGKTQKEKPKVLEALFALKEIKDAISYPCYSPDKSHATGAVEGQAAKIKYVEKKLGQNDWLVGDSPTVSDLFLMQITDLFQMITEGAWFKDHPTLEAHNARTKEIPNIKEYRNSDRFFEGPFHSPVAGTNNVPEDYWK